MTTSVITANRLTDGVVVWWDAIGQWSEDAARAHILDAAGLHVALETALQASKQIAVDVREVEVSPAVPPAPLARRERLRQSGPSVRADLAATSSSQRWTRGPFPLPPSLHSRSPFAGTYRYDEYDRQYLRDRAEQFREQVGRRLSGALNEDEFKPLRLMNGLYLQLHG